MLNELQPNFVKAPPLIAYLADGRSITLDICVEIDLIFQSIPIKQRFYFMKELPEPALLGLDFFRDAGLEITQQKNQVTELEEVPSEEQFNLETLFYIPSEELYHQLEINEEFKEEDYTLNNIVNIYFNNSIEQVQLNTLNAGSKVPKEQCFENFEFKIESTDEVEIRKIKELLFQFKHLFAFKMTDLVGAKGVFHAINTGDSKPINQRNYRTSYEGTKRDSTSSPRNVRCRDNREDR